jgi:hypothetical protein
MGKNAVVLIGLLIVGGIMAVVVWLLVFLPFRVMQPIDFTPLVVTQKTSQQLEQRVERFVRGSEGSIDLYREDLGALVIRGVEQELGLEVAALAVDFTDSSITTIINVEIGNIPSGGYLTWILTRRDVEYTTTLITAEVWADEGSVAYELLDFRIGKFKIPDLATRRLMGNGKREIQGVYIQKIDLYDDYIRISTR